MRTETSAPTLLDFTTITRDVGKVLTTVVLHTPHTVKVPKPPERASKHDQFDYVRQFEWMRFSQCRLRKLTFGDRETWEVAAYLLNATDVEHDSAWAFKFELVGVRLDSVDYGQTCVSGWIRSDDANSFRVPSAGYNPLALPATTKCKECKRSDGHAIVPEGYYVPKSNEVLFEQVRGSFVEIRTGLVHPK
jgi:hypothetical protein